MNFYLATPADTSLVNPDLRFQALFTSCNELVCGRSVVGAPEAADIVVLFEAFSFKQVDYADDLARCPFAREYAEKILAVNYDDSCSAFLPGCYTSLTPAIYSPSLHRPCAYPKTYNRFVDAMAEGLLTRKPTLLASFRGNVRSQAVRRALAAELAGRAGFRVTEPVSGFHQHSEAEQVEYLEEIADSEFVLCPRGASPATYRMFEVMQMGRCPVILSDDWVPIPGIDWETCSLRVAEHLVRSLPEILAEHRERAAELGSNARRVWEMCFAIERKYQSYGDHLIELHESRRRDGPGGIEDLQRMWRSHDFRRRRGWTLMQRLSRVRSKWIATIR